MVYKSLSGKNLWEAPAIFEYRLPLLASFQNLIMEPGLVSDHHVPSATVLSSFPPQEKLPFPHPSSNFYSESGLSKGLTAVWVGAFGLVYCFWYLPKLAATSLGICFLHFVRALLCTHFLFIKSTVDSIIRKVGVGWLLSIGKSLPFLLIAGNQRSAAHLRSWKLSLCLIPLSIPGSLLTWWQLMPQSLSLSRRMACLKCIVWVIPAEGVGCSLWGCKTGASYSWTWKVSGKVWSLGLGKLDCPSGKKGLLSL